MPTDYRNTSNTYEYENVLSYKEELKKEMKKDIKRVRNFYNHIHPKDSDYHLKFGKIYNLKCAYCGIPAGEIKEIRDFEIDHIVCESSFSKM